MIKTIITLLTFIPWFLYSVSTSQRTIKKIRNKEKKTKLINKNDIVLTIIFSLFTIIFYKSPQIKLVKILLFITFNIYLLLYSIYDKNNKTSLEKKEQIILLINILFFIIPIIFYLITKYYTITYYIMFIYNILNGLLTLLSIKLSKKNEKYL